MPVQTIDATNIQQYATFQSHNRRVVVNQYGVFACYLGDTDPHGGDTNLNTTLYHWYLWRSTDQGASWARVYSGTGAEHPPVLETDSAGRLYLIYNPDVAGTSTFFLRFEAANGFTSPTVSTTLAGLTTAAGYTGGKFALCIDEGRHQLYYSAWGRMVARLSLDGVVLGIVVVNTSTATNIAEYPLLSLAENGDLYLAWTVSPLVITVTPDWDIHVVCSKNGGLAWQKLDGTLLTLPVICDDSGPTDEIIRSDEFGRVNWLANMLAHNGKLHFLYESQGPGNREHYLRYDLVTGLRDIDVWPAIVADTLQFSANDGQFIRDPASARLYLAGTTDPHAAGATQTRLCVLYSDNDGTSWHDHAQSAAIGALFTAEYGFSAAAVTAPTGSIVGIYTQDRAGPVPSVRAFSTPGPNQLPTGGAVDVQAPSGQDRRKVVVI